MDKESMIVGLGASGGIESLKLFFSYMPKNPGVPFVVIQHLARNNNSDLAYILSKQTPLKVIKVMGQEKVKPNHIYVIKENCKMMIKNGTLFLRERLLSEKNNTSIDYFFKSLAEDVKENAIAILLSGTGLDGFEGIKAIEAKRGLVLLEEQAITKLNGISGIEIHNNHNYHKGSVTELARKVMEVVASKSIKA